MWQMVGNRHHDRVALGRDADHFARCGVVETLSDDTVCIQPHEFGDGADVDVGAFVKFGTNPAGAQRRDFDSGAMQLIGQTLCVGGHPGFDR